MRRSSLRLRGSHRILSVGLLMMVGSGVAVSTHSLGSSGTSASAPTSWISSSTLVTVYGRGFGIAPILGRLGIDRGFGDVARQLRPYAEAVTAHSPTRHARLAIHLIYGLATQCNGGSACVSYLDDTGTNIERDYIEPAARRGWLVILDDQLGRSNPVREIRRMMRKGYLQHDNVEVAFDPEFRMTVGQMTPGVPVGSVSAHELNAAENVMNACVKRNGLRHSKLMLVHQWLPMMIRHRIALRSNFRYVRPVIVMDAIGGAGDKAQGYNSLLGPDNLSRSTLRGIKLFLPSPYEPPGTVDTPVLTWSQIFGGTERAVPALQAEPQVIVIT